MTTFVRIVSIFDFFGKNAPKMTIDLICGSIVDTIEGVVCSQLIVT